MNSRGRSMRAGGIAGLAGVILALPGTAWGKSCVVGSGGGAYAALNLALKDGCDDIEVQHDLIEDPVTLGPGSVTIWASKPRLVPPFAVPKGAELHLEGVELVGRPFGTVTWDHGCDSAISAAQKRFVSAPNLLAYPSICVTGGTVFLETVSVSPALGMGIGNAGIVVQAGELNGDFVTLSGFGGMPAAIVGPNPASASTPILNLTNGTVSKNTDTAILSDHGSISLVSMAFSNNDAQKRATAADVELIGGTLSVTGGTYTNPGVTDGTPASAFALDAANGSWEDVTISGYRATSGGAVRARGWSGLSFSKVFLDDLAAYFGGAIAIEDPTGVTIESTTVTRSSAVDGGVVWVSGGSDSSYVDLLYNDMTAGFASGASGLAPDRGAILSASGPTAIRITGGAYGGDATLVPRVGGAFYVDGASRFETDGTHFHDFRSTDDGGSVYLTQVDDVYLGFSRIDDSIAGGLGGAVFATGVTWFASEQSWFIRGTAYEGGHLALIDTSFDIVGSLFAYGSAVEHAGSVYVAGKGDPQRLLADRFCENASNVGGGAAFVTQGPTGAAPNLEISHTAFLWNTDPYVDAVKVVAGSLAMTSNTFVGVDAAAGGDVLIAMYDNPLYFYDSMMLRADYGVHLGFKSAAFDEDWLNDWQVNHSVAFGDPMLDLRDGPNHQRFDPLLRGDAGVGDDCFFSVMPEADSPAWASGSPLETGDPAGLGVYGNDPVRVAWDLDFDGVNGFADCDDGDPFVTDSAEGPIPRPSGRADTDQDGAVSEVCGGDDCDDTRADVGPGAYDAPGDGFDANCDGVDDCDPDRDGHQSVSCGGDDCDSFDASIHAGAPDPVDGIDQDCDGVDGACPDADNDGHTAEACGGDDCDDDAATVFPEAPEIDLDGIDQDCDGDDATPWAVGGGGCVAGAGDRGLSVGWIGALMILGARRRTRSVV